MTSQAHRELLAWLDARQDQMAREAADLIFAQIPRYRAADDEQLYHDVVAHCRNVVGILLRARTQDREPDTADYDWTSAQAVRRVSVGLEVTDFLRGFRLAQLTTWNNVQTAVREHPEWTPAALDLVDPIMRVYEMGSKVAAVAWLEAQRWRVAGVERLHADLLEDLLLGRVPTVPARRAELERCGLADGKPYVVGVASVVERARLPESIDALSEVCRALEREAGGLVVTRGGEVYGVHPAPDAPADPGRLGPGLTQAVRQLHERGIDVRLGVSSAQARWADVPAGASEATRARQLAGGAEVVRIDDLALVDYLIRTADETALRVIDPRVREVLAEDLAGSGQLVETLRAYVRANLNAKEAAEELTVHANTVYYRLERFGERVGRDLRQVDALIELLLAARLLESP